MRLTLFSNMPYIKTKHITDAAYPRTNTSSTILPSDRLKIVYDKYKNAEPLSENKLKFNFIFSHVTATSKALWIYHIEKLYELSKTQTSWQVDTVVALDHAMQGESALINEHKLGISFNFKDFGEDIISVIINENLNCTDSKLVCVGSSFGGSAALCAVLWKPNLFDSLIAAEPCIYLSSEFVKKCTNSLGKLLSLNKSDFGTREEAEYHIGNQSFCKRFHPKIKEHLFREDIVYDETTGRFKRTSPYEQSNCIVTANPSMVNVIQTNMKYLSVPYTHVVAKYQNLFIPADTQKSLDSIPKTETNKIVEMDGLHTCALDKPDEFIDIIVDHLDRRVENLSKQKKTLVIAEMSNEEREKVRQKWWREYRQRGFFKYWDSKL